jgi:hypothetical protein
MEGAWIMNTKTNLTTNERFILETKPPWIALIIAPILSIMFWSLLFILGLNMMFKNGLWGLLVFFSFAMIVGGFNSILFGFRGITTKFVVTDKRIIAKTGLLRQHQWDVLVSSLISINIKQSLTARVWHYGTLILSDGGRKEMRFPSISNPKVVQEKLNSLIGTKANLGKAESVAGGVLTSPSVTPHKPVPAPVVAPSSPVLPGVAPVSPTFQAVSATPRVVDLRPAEERQIQREAQRDLGDDESIAHQLLELIRRSNAEYGKDMDAYRKTRARAREIGEYLCANGGDPRMKKIGYRVKALGGNTRILEDIWDGICGWMA